MLTKTKKIRVLLYGNIFRDSRSQILAKLLFNSGYHVSLVCPDYYWKPRLVKVFVIDKIIAFFFLIELWTKAAFTDVIYLPPMNNRFIKSALWVAKVFRKKLVVEMYISLYDTFVGDGKLLEGKPIKANSSQAKAMLKKDSLALTRSDYIIHTANYELTYWEKILDIKINQEKVFIAPNCNVSTLVHQRSFKKDGLLKICWWGTFIPLHGLDNILQAIEILSRKKIKFVCSLFGVDNALFSEYAEKIRQYQLEDYVCLRKDLSFSDNTLPKYLVDRCDLALGIFGNTDKAYHAIPNKLIEALSMGIPTLTMNSPALKEFFEPEVDLWTCEPSPEAIAESILTIANGAAYPVNWEQTRQKVLDTFSVNRYQEVVSKVLERITEDLLGREISDLQSSVKIYEQKIS